LASSGALRPPSLEHDWILSLHELSAFALVASLVLFWILVVASRSLTEVDQRIAFGRIGDVVGGRVIGVGFVGTIVFGLWLSFSKDDYAPWDGWIVMAIILWVIGGATGGRAGAEYQKVLERAQALKLSGEAAQPGEFGLRPRSSCWRSRRSQPSSSSST
jgi:MFS family permease